MLWSVCLAETELQSHRAVRQQQTLSNAVCVGEGGRGGYKDEGCRILGLYSIMCEGKICACLCVKSYVAQTFVILFN